MNYLRLIIVTTVLLLPLASPRALHAQGTVAGRVIDQTEALIPGASVEVLPAGADDHIETLTEGDGTYRIDNLPAGPAEITFRLINL